MRIYIHMPANAMLLTPPATGAIAVFLLTGAALPLLENCCKLNGALLSPGSVRRVTLVDGKDSIDDGLLACTAPGIYELHLHGGQAVVQRTAEVLQRIGFEMLDVQSAPGHAAAAGAWGDPSYAKGIGAEIIQALPGAHTITALRLLANQRDHGLGAWRNHCLELLQGQTPLWLIQSDVQWILLRSRALNYLIKPARIAIVGPPNAGKSTLANALMGRPVSIASDIAGTTRDWVDAIAVLASGPVRLAVTFVDTAGLRSTTDPIERESIRRSYAQIDQADALIAVVDGSNPEHVSANFLDFLGTSLHRPPTVVAINKLDLGSAAALGSRQVGAPVVAISALMRQGLPELITAVMTLLDLDAVDEREPFVFSDRQRGILERLTLCKTLDDARQLLIEL
jgi:tRNA modification GTPase